MSKLRMFLTRKFLIKVFLLLIFFFVIHHVLTDTTFYLMFINPRGSGKMRSASMFVTYEQSRAFVVTDPTPAVANLLNLEKLGAKTVPVEITEAKVRTEAVNYDRNTTTLPPNNYNHIHVLLITYPRCGSSFMGNLLQSPKQAFYHFEPIHYLFDYTRPRKRKRNIRNSITPVFRAQTPQEFLYDVFHCKYSQQFMQWAELRPNYKTLQRNEKYWNQCVQANNVTKLCYSVPRFKHICSNYTMQVVKTIRMNIHGVQQLLERYRDLNLKIIHLVRDPRGTMNSRSKKPITHWCSRDISCYSPRVFCAGLESDLSESEQLKERYPERYFLVRYEDLCCDMYHKTEEIFRFLGFGELPQETIDFLNSHNLAIIKNTTSARERYLEPSYTTVRNSMRTAFAWRRELKFSHVKVVQRHCEQVMRKLDYFPLNRPEDAKNSSHRVVLNITECGPS